VDAIKTPKPKDFIAEAAEINLELGAIVASTERNGSR
jgi:hypothetical protein